MGTYLVHTALILCGGRGERLRPLTDDIPKPLLPVAGKPILEWQITTLVKNGVKRVVLCTGYKSEKIESYFKGRDLGVEIIVSKEDPSKPLGTAGPILKAKQFIKETFMALNGDIITNADLREMVSLHKSRKATVTILLVKLRSPYGVIEVNNSSRILSFKEKPTLPYWINGGVYVMEPEILDFIPDRGSLEEDVFPRVIKAGKIVLGFKTPENIYWRDIGTFKDYKAVNRELSSNPELLQ